MRRRNEWKKWIPSRVSSTDAGSSSDMLASSFQHITVKEESTNQSKVSEDTD